VSVLPPGLPAPVPTPDGLDRPYWEGTRRHELRVQRCTRCRTWRWGPEWSCHACRSFETDWVSVKPTGTIFSWQRVWHPALPALDAALPYVILLVALPQAGDVRMVGNLVGDARGDVTIGARVHAEFEDHDVGETPYTLVQWRLEKEQK